MSNANIQYTIVHAKLSDIIPTTKNARKTFDEAKLKELAQAIKQNGQTTPGIAKPLEGGKYELIAGERRRRALTMNKSETMELKVLPANVDAKRERIIAFIDNTEREDLTTYEQAAALAEMVSEFKMSGADLARETGHNVSYVNRLLKPFSQLHPTIRNAWQDGNKACTVELLGKLVSKFGEDGEAQLVAFRNYVDHGTFEAPEGSEEDGDQDGDKSNGKVEKEKPGFRIRPSMVQERYAIMWKGLKNVKDSDITVEWVRAALQFTIGKRQSPPEGIDLPEEKVKAKSGQSAGAKAARKSGEV